MEGQPHIFIEKVQPDDLKGLEKIFTKEFGKEVHVELIRQRMRRVRQFYYLLLPLSNLSLWVKNLFNIYVFRINGNLAGFIQISHLNSRQLHLDYIAVSKQYRGKGIGTLVLRELLDKVADTQEFDMVLEVRTDNPAYRLYKRLGFVRQAMVLHYERWFASGKAGEVAEKMPDFRRMKGTDRPQLYRLYRASISRRLQQVAKREYSEFNPSLFRRNMDWLKNRLMKNRRREYVVERDGKLVAALEIRNYPKAGRHTVGAIIHPKYEYLRERLMRQAIGILQNQYSSGSINTTVFDDDPRKQIALEKLGFLRRDAYFLMFRPPNPQNRHYIKRPVHASFSGGTIPQAKNNMYETVPSGQFAMELSDPMIGR